MRKESGVNSEQTIIIMPMLATKLKGKHFTIGRLTLATLLNKLLPTAELCLVALVTAVLIIQE